MRRPPMKPDLNQIAVDTSTFVDRPTSRPMEITTVLAGTRILTVDSHETCKECEEDSITAKTLLRIILRATQRKIRSTSGQRIGLVQF